MDKYLASHAATIGVADRLARDGCPSLDAFQAQWRHLYALPNLTPKTMESYDYLWARYIHGGLGSAALDSLTPLLLEQWKADQLAAGVGVESVKRCLIMLQGVLQRAVEWQYLTANPARYVRKPPSRRKRAVRPLPPEKIEEMRARLMRNEQPRDALLVCLLGYCGLRPGEALALHWESVGARRLLIDSCVSLGELKETKTGGCAPFPCSIPWSRISPLFGPDCRRTDHGLIFAAAQGRPGRSPCGGIGGGACLVLARAAGLIGVSPYDLRHSFVSLLIAEGRSILEVARQAGHSPTMTLNVYGHVFDEFDPTERMPAAHRILQARAAVLRLSRLLHGSLTRWYPGRVPTRAGAAHPARRQTLSSYLAPSPSRRIGHHHSSPINYMIRARDYVGDGQRMPAPEASASALTQEIPHGYQARKIRTDHEPRTTRST